VPNEQPRRGMGLLGIRERVNSFGGEFRLETSAGNGTRITVELPDSEALAPA